MLFRSLTGKHKQWRQAGAFILLTGLLSVAIWVAWIVMFVYGNGKKGGPTWDNPTLAIALVANAWVFLILYSIPELCSLTREEEGQPGFGEDLYPSRGVGYETILKEHSGQNMFMENKAFSMDEPNSGVYTRTNTHADQFCDRRVIIKRSLMGLPKQQGVLTC